MTTQTAHAEQHPALAAAVGAYLDRAGAAHARATGTYAEAWIFAAARTLRRTWPTAAAVDYETNPDLNPDGPVYLAAVRDDAGAVLADAERIARMTAEEDQEELAVAFHQLAWARRTLNLDPARWLDEADRGFRSTGSRHPGPDGREVFRMTTTLPAPDQLPSGGRLGQDARERTRRYAAAMDERHRAAATDLAGAYIYEAAAALREAWPDADSVLFHYEISWPGPNRSEPDFVAVRDAAGTVLVDEDRLDEHIGADGDNPQLIALHLLQTAFALVRTSGGFTFAHSDPTLPDWTLTTAGRHPAPGASAVHSAVFHLPAPGLLPAPPTGDRRPGPRRHTHRSAPDRD